MRIHVRLVAGLALAFAASACSGASATPSPSPVPTILPVIAQSEPAVGLNRFLFLLVGANNAPVSAPDRTVTVDVYPVQVGDPLTVPEGPPAASSAATFVWGIEGSRGFYHASVEFATAGDWTAVFTTSAPGQPTEVIPAKVRVLAETRSVRVGQKAPSTKTPTLADVGGDIAKLSTDKTPDPRYYQVSEDAALAAGKPFVLVFATPAFCQSAICGPTFDRVKQVAAKYPEMTFINVEPYKLEYADGRLQPVLQDINGTSQFVPTDVTKAWGILTEPWVYVVDGSGIVRGSFEATIGEEELSAAIDAVT